MATSANCDFLVGWVRLSVCDQIEVVFSWRWVCVNFVGTDQDVLSSKILCHERQSFRIFFSADFRGAAAVVLFDSEFDT